MTQPINCQNCHAEMEPGNQTKSRAMQWTEYTCPECGLFCVVGIREPKAAVVVEAETDAPAKKPKKAAAPKTKIEVESFADDPLAGYAAKDEGIGGEDD